MNLKSLQVALPEDIEKLKGRGDFDLARKVIDRKLAGKLPQILRDRLELEKLILERIYEDYPYSKKEALLLMEETFYDVKEEELDELREENLADWFYIDGELHFKSDFLDTLVKLRPDWASRSRKRPEDKEGDFSLLDETIEKMKDQGQLSYHIQAWVSLKIKKEHHPGGLVRVHLPIPIEYAQVSQLKLLDISPEPTYIGNSSQGQPTVFFEGSFDKDQVFSVEFSFTNRVAYQEPSPDEVSDFQPNFFTQEEEPHIVFTPYIKALCQELLEGETNPLLKARKIYDFCTKELIYSFMRPYITIENIPHYCLTSLKGDCGVLALTFITLCRCAGIPARWQSGLYANPLSIGCHDWAQFYIEPFGWLFADCSFGGSAYRAGNLSRWNFYAYNLEPFRIPFAQEFQSPFYPERRFLRNDPYDNQTGEAEGETRSFSDRELVRSSGVVEIRELK